MTAGDTTNTNGTSTNGRRKPWLRPVGLRRPRSSVLALLAATSGLAMFGTAVDVGLGSPMADAATPRPLVRGKVASVGTGSFTLTHGVATITVDVAPTTTYTDAAVSVASFATLAVGTRVAVLGSLTGANQVEASAVRFLETTPRGPLPTTGPGEARLGAGLGRVRGATAFVPLSCEGGACRGTLRLSVEEVVALRRGRSTVRRDELVPAGAVTYAMGPGQGHLVSLRLAPNALAVLARDRRLAATATILAAGRPTVVEHLQLLA